mmetsp:Transcript_4830/g.9215  ORF Transcript_4830/g.9215 Transcript_4830/m.9215 type:complete len:264 (-) Transcript_4830:528-1319(-)
MIVIIKPRHAKCTVNNSSCNNCCQDDNILDLSSIQNSLRSCYFKPIDPPPVISKTSTSSFSPPATSSTTTHIIRTSSFSSTREETRQEEEQQKEQQKIQKEHFLPSPSPPRMKRRFFAFQPDDNQGGNDDFYHHSPPTTPTEISSNITHHRPQESWSPPPPSNPILKRRKLMISSYRSCTATSATTNFSAFHNACDVGGQTIHQEEYQGRSSVLSSTSILMESLQFPFDSFAITTRTRRTIDRKWKLMPRMKRKTGKGGEMGI